MRGKQLMTFWELCRALLRHWPIVLVGAVCTIGAGVVAISDDGVYFSRTNIVFKAPTSNEYPNAIRTQLEDVIVTAGVVAKRLTGPGRVTKFASPEVTSVGLGVRDGWSIRLRDIGGQWATNFPVQMLTLDVVGPSREVVQQRQHDVIQRVEQELYQLQRDAGVNPAKDITALPAPEFSVVYYVSGNKPRALGMTAVLGVSVTITVVLGVDRRRRRREVERSPLGEDVATDGGERTQLPASRGLATSA
jgi:hypothetical protein